MNSTTACPDLVQIGQTGGAGREGGEERGAEPQLIQARAPRQHIFCEHQCVLTSWSRPGEFLMHHPFPPHLSIQSSGGGRCPANHMCLKMAKTVVFQQPFTSGVCCMAILYG